MKCHAVPWLPKPAMADVRMGRPPGLVCASGWFARWFGLGALICDPGRRWWRPGQGGPLLHDSQKTARTGSIAIATSPFARLRVAIRSS
jgi:hypothetical protein